MRLKGGDGDSWSRRQVGRTFRPYLVTKQLPNDLKAEECDQIDVLENVWQCGGWIQGKGMLEDWKTIKLLVLNNLGKRAKA